MVIGRFRRALMLLASSAVTVAVVLVGGSPPAGEPRAAIVATPTPEPPLQVFVPEEVEIPAIAMRAPTVPVGTESDGAMGTPSGAVDVAWWHGVRAGEGNLLLAGHRDWKGELGSFFRLSELGSGDEIVVRGQGRELTFRVSWSEQMDGGVDATDILGDQGAPVVTLITCGGEFDRSIRHYTDRVVVRGVLAA